MKSRIEMRRWVSCLMLASFATAALSPAAHADPWRRYKGVPDYGPPAVRHVASQRVVYYGRPSDAAPVFAALIGGLVIGSAIAHAVAPAPVHAYYYWDPTCHERYAALPEYDAHFGYRYHPRVLRVVSVESGRCVDTVHWADGGWHSERGRDWDDD